MAVTAVSICNMALALVGADGTITALTQDNQNARVCNQFYDAARQTLLRSHPWNFATGRIASYPEWDTATPYSEGALVEYDDVVYRALAYTLGEQPDISAAAWAATTLGILAVAATPINEWDYAYTLPTDCLRVLHINEARDAFRIEGRLLLTDEPEVVLVYVKDEETPASFDPLFIRALAYRLAIEIAPILTTSSRRALELEDHFRKVILPEATSADAFEAEGDAYIRSEWENARL